jgi:ubiquinone/menaquinone biosynthesis C-methylase UbiE
MLSHDMKTTEPWWESLYDDHVADVLLERTSPSEISLATDFLMEVLDLREGSMVLDQCCGTGRIAWSLAARGVSVLGVDIIPSYIERARRRDTIVPLTPRFQTADAFEFSASPVRDAAFNWWTSFGYARDDADNLRMLRRARESIRSGGSYVVDFMNIPGIHRHFLPRVTTCAGDVTLVRDTTLDVADNVMRKTWTFTFGDGRQIVRRSAVRLYDPAALHSLFLEAGFDTIRLYGDVDASPLTVESPRCIIYGRNPP